MNNNKPTIEYVSATERASGGRILPATDLIELVIQAVEVGRTFVTEKRDVAAIQSHHDLALDGAQKSHDEVMAKIVGFYDTQDKQIALIEKIATQLIDAGKFEEATQLTGQLLEVLKNETPITDGM